MIILSIIISLMVYYTTKWIYYYPNAKLKEYFMIIQVLSVLNISTAVGITSAGSTPIAGYLSLINLVICIVQICMIYKAYKKRIKIEREPVEAAGMLLTYTSPTECGLVPVCVGEVIFAIGTPEEYFNTVEPMRIEKIEVMPDKVNSVVTLSPGEVKFTDFVDQLGVKIFFDREDAQERAQYFQHVDAFTTVMERNGYEIKDPSQEKIHNDKE